MVLQILDGSVVFFKYADEIFFICLFVLVTLVNKYVLSELRFTVPTVFQGWQTLSCVVLLSILIKFKKIKNDLQILDTKALSLLLPALVCFTLGIVAGSKALAELGVPVFLAITSLYPAILIFLVKSNEIGNVSLKVCGSTVVLATVVSILICTPHISYHLAPYVWLLGHILLNITYFVYLKKVNLDLSNTTQIYYRNFFSIIFLFPISFYLDVLHLPGNSGWQFYGGCFLSGVLGTLLQIWTFKISTKPNFLRFEGIAKVACSLLAHNLFFANIEPVIWVMISLNFLVCIMVLKGTDKEKDLDVRRDINLAIPQGEKNYSYTLLV